jgi:hypothetical protein
VKTVERYIIAEATVFISQDGEIFLIPFLVAPRCTHAVINKSNAENVTPFPPIRRQRCHCVGVFFLFLYIDFPFLFRLGLLPFATFRVPSALVQLIRLEVVEVQIL